MKLKLIQTGGFAGKPKYAEEDLSLHPKQLQQEVDMHFPKAPAAQTVSTASQSRDAFQYFLEYKGIRIGLNDELKVTPVVEKLLDKLKEKLHY